MHRDENRCWAGQETSLGKETLSLGVPPISLRMEAWDTSVLVVAHLVVVQKSFFAETRSGSG